MFTDRLLYQCAKCTKTFAFLQTFFRCRGTNLHKSLHSTRFSGHNFYENLKTAFLILFVSTTYPSHYILSLITYEIGTTLFFTPSYPFHKYHSCHFIFHITHKTIISTHSTLLGRSFFTLYRYAFLFFY